MPNSPLLAFESANFGASVALLSDSRLLEKKVQSSYAQSYSLIGLIEALLKENNITPHDLKGIVTTLGPGSFTGLRNALAVAKAFAFGLSCPVMGLTSFEFIYRAYASNSLGIIIDSHRSEPFCALYGSGGHFLKNPVYLSEKDLPLFMEDHEVYDTRLKGFPTASTLAKVVHKQGLLEKHHLFPLQALYLRPPDIGLS